MSRSTYRRSVEWADLLSAMLHPQRVAGSRNADPRYGNPAEDLRKTTPLERGEHSQASPKKKFLTDCVSPRYILGGEKNAATNPGKICPKFAQLPPRAEFYSTDLNPLQLRHHLTGSGQGAIDMFFGMCQRSKASFKLRRR